MGCETAGSRGISSPVDRVMEAWKQSRTEFRSNSSSHTFASGTAAKTQQGEGGVHGQATDQSGRALHPVTQSLNISQRWKYIVLNLFYLFFKNTTLHLLNSSLSLLLTNTSIAVLLTRPHFNSIWHKWKSW